jgi:proteasome lid subunit RPN8/RPN11
VAGLSAGNGIRTHADRKIHGLSRPARYPLCHPGSSSLLGFLFISVFCLRITFSAKVISCPAFGVCMNRKLVVSLSAELLDSIFESAKRLYPKETFLLLRGKRSKGVIQVNDLVVPPLAVYGYGFANLPFHMLPIDFSIVGTVHSHPSGNIRPSNVDLNHFFGRMLMIVGFPFKTSQNVAVYDSKGDPLPLQVIQE